MNNRLKKLKSDHSLIVEKISLIEKKEIKNVKEFEFLYKLKMKEIELFIAISTLEDDEN